MVQWLKKNFFKEFQKKNQRDTLGKSVVGGLRIVIRRMNEKYLMENSVGSI
jgi:hypothetical protein